MAKRVLKKEDTVILSDAVQKLQLEEKTEDGKLADLVYRASHVWSLRHPERAKECFHEDVETHVVTAKVKFVGLPGFVALCLSLHDTLEDFTFEINDIVTSGTMANGRISYRYTVHGKWVKEVGGYKGHGKNIDIDGVSFFTVKDGKISKHESVINNGADIEYTTALDKAAQEFAKLK